MLSPSQRRRLAELMLLDVLDGVRKAGLLSRCYVISSSKSTRRLAERAGANTIEEASDRGVNSAVEAGLKDLGADDIMVVPSDLPLLKGAEIRGALALRSAGMEVVLTPSLEFDGTNLLLMDSSRPLALSFDRDSFWNHLESAAREGRRLAVYSARGFRFDVDTASHLRGLAREKSPGRAAALVRKLVRQ